MTPALLPVLNINFLHAYYPGDLFTTVTIVPDNDTSAIIKRRRIQSRLFQNVFSVYNDTGRQNQLDGIQKLTFFVFTTDDVIGFVTSKSTVPNRTQVFYFPCDVSGNVQVRQAADEKHQLDFRPMSFVYVAKNALKQGDRIDIRSETANRVIYSQVIQVSVTNNFSVNLMGQTTGRYSLLVNDTAVYTFYATGNYIVGKPFAIIDIFSICEASDRIRPKIFSLKWDSKKVFWKYFVVNKRGIYSLKQLRIQCVFDSDLHDAIPVSQIVRLADGSQAGIFVTGLIQCEFESKPRFQLVDSSDKNADGAYQVVIDTLPNADMKTGKYVAANGGISGFVEIFIYI